MMMIPNAAYNATWSLPQDVFQVINTQISSFKQIALGKKQPPMLNRNTK